MINKEDYIGQDSEKKFPCMSPYHNPPTHLYIPPGETKIHVCPSCGKKTEMHGSAISW